MSCQNYKLYMFKTSRLNDCAFSFVVLLGLFLGMVSFASSSAFAITNICFSNWHPSDVPVSSCFNPETTRCVSSPNGTAVFPSGTRAPSSGVWNSVIAYPIPTADLTVASGGPCSVQAVNGLVNLAPISNVAGLPNPYGNAPYFGVAVSTGGIMGGASQIGIRSAFFGTSTMPGSRVGFPGNPPYPPTGGAGLNIEFTPAYAVGPIPPAGIETDMWFNGYIPMYPPGTAGSEPRNFIDAIPWQDPTVVIAAPNWAPHGLSAAPCGLLNPNCSGGGLFNPTSGAFPEPFRNKLSDPIVFLPTGEAMMVPPGTQVLRPIGPVVWPDPGADGDLNTADGIDGRVDTVGDECPSNNWPVEPRCQATSGVVITLSSMGEVLYDANNPQNTTADVDGDGIACFYDSDEPCGAIDADGDGVDCSRDTGISIQDGGNNYDEPACPTHVPIPTFQIQVGDILWGPNVSFSSGNSVTVPFHETIDADGDGIACVTDPDESCPPPMYMEEQTNVDADGDGIACQFDNTETCPPIDNDGDGVPCIIDPDDMNPNRPTIIEPPANSCQLMTTVISTGGGASAGGDFITSINGTPRPFSEDWDGDGLSCSNDAYDKEAGIALPGESCIVAVQYLANGVEVPWNLPELMYVQGNWIDPGDDYIGNGNCITNPRTGQQLCPGGNPNTTTGGTGIASWLPPGYDNNGGNGRCSIDTSRAALDILLGNFNLNSFLSSCIESVVDAGIENAVGAIEGEEFRTMIDDWYNKAQGFRASIQDMTEQLNVAVIDQSRSIGSFIDAANQVKTQNLLQQKEKEAIERLKPGENACAMATIANSAQKALQTGREIKDAINTQAAARALNLPGSGTEEGPDRYANIRWTNYCQIFADTTDNAGYNGCDNIAPLPNNVPGADIDIERFLFRDTIDMTNANERKAANAILTNLVDSKPLMPLPEDATVSDIEIADEVRRLRLLRDHYAALRQPLINVVSGIISRRVGIPETELEVGTGIAVQNIRVQAGVPINETTTSPSYNEMMLARTKEYFFNVDKIIKTGADIGELRQELATNEALIAILVEDIKQLEKQLNSVLAVQASITLNKENDSTTSNKYGSPRPR